MIFLQLILCPALLKIGCPGHPQGGLAGYFVAPSCFDPPERMHGTPDRSERCEPVSSEARRLARVTRSTRALAHSHGHTGTMGPTGPVGSLNGVTWFLIVFE